MLLAAKQLCEFSKILNVSMTTVVFCSRLLKLESTSIFTAVSIFMTLLEGLKACTTLMSEGGKKRHCKPQDLYLS